MADRIDREEFGDDAAYRVRINFHNMMELACENRKVAKAGSVPPEMKMVWKKMEEEGIRTEIIDRNEMGGSEKDLPDQTKTSVGDASRWHEPPENAGDRHAIDGRQCRLGIWEGISDLPARDEERGLEYRAHQLVSILQQVVEEVGITKWPLHWPGHILPKRDISSALGESAGVERAPLVTPATVAETGKPFC